MELYLCFIHLNLFKGEEKNMESVDIIFIVREKCKFFNMKQICEFANVNYSTFRNWKNNNYSLSDEKIKNI